MTTNPSPSPQSQSGKSDTDTAKAAAKSLRDDAEQTVREVGKAVADGARTRAENAKAGVADEISSVSHALRRASEELRDGSPQERTFGYVAGNLADFADTVRGKDLGELVDDMSEFARRNPIAFLGGAALLGFAGVRMAKASRRARDEQKNREPASAYGSQAPGTAPVTPGHNGNPSTTGVSS